MLVVIPTTSYDGETATAYSLSLGEYVEGQEGITLEQLKALDIDGSAPPIDDMSPEERYQWLVEDIGLYTIDELTVIDEKHLSKLEELSDEALDHGTDSALYDACQWYNECVRSMGVKVIDLFAEGVIVQSDF